MRSVSPSSLSLWQQCKLRWWYEYVAGVPRPEESNVDLLRGTAGHAALEAYWGAEPQDRSQSLLLLNAQQALNEAPGEEGDKNLAGHEVRQALEAFWKTLGQQLEVQKLRTEVRLEVPVAAGWELHTVLDAVLEDEDKVVVLEHKFPKSSPYVDTYLWWNNQHRLGAWALQTKKLVYVRYTLCSPRVTVCPPDLLILPEAQQEELAIVQEMATQAQTYTIDSAPNPSYGFHCVRCVMKTRCLSRITGGDEE